MGKTRRKFSDEFKQEAVKLSMRPGMNLSAAARDLGVNLSVLRRWVANHKAGHYEIAPGRALKTEAAAELERVKRELAKVKMERDILKKALGYFAKDPT